MSEGGAPWRLSGAARANATGGELESLELRLGADERPATLTGAARFDAATGRARWELASKQIDLDRLLGREGRPTTPGQALREAVAAFSRAREGFREATGGRWAIPVDLDLQPGAVTLGGETIGDARLVAAFAPDAPISGALEASLPGRARISTQGQIEGGAAPRFRGKLALEVGDARRLRAWLGDVWPSGLNLGAARLGVEGDTEISPVTFALRGATLRLDRSTLRGDVTLTAPVGGERGRAFADLTSDALDLDSAPDVTGLASAAPGYDYSLTLDARAVRVSRFGDGMLDAGRVRLRLTRQGERAELERLRLDDVGGASLAAQGRFDGRGGDLTATLDADRLGDLAALVQRLAPGRWSDAFAARAARLAPAKLSLAAQVGPDFEPRQAALDGALGGSRLTGRVGADQGRLDARLDVAHPDAGALLRQLGVDAALGPGSAAGGGGGGSISIAAAGPPEGPLETTAEAVAPAARLHFSGTIDPQGLALGRPQRLGRLSVDATDLAPLATALGVLAPDSFAHGGADVETTLSLDPLGLKIDGLRGWALGARIAGEGRLTAGGEGGRLRLDGAASMDRLALTDVAALALGVSPAGPGPRRGVWADRAFAPALGPGAPLLSVDLSIGALDLGVGAPGPATLKVAAGPDAVTVERLSAPFSGGRLEGRGALRRSGLDATFTGAAHLRDVGFDEIFSVGALDLDLEAAGAGRSAAGIVASLGGEGRALLKQARLRRAGAQVVAGVAAAVDDGRTQIEEGAIGRAIALALDTQETALGGPREVAVSLTGGVARLAPTLVEIGEASLTSRASLNLVTMEPELRQTLVAPPPRDHWSGGAPRVEMTWTRAGREVDAAALSNGLAARQVARDLERIEALEADIAERAAQLRRQKAFDFLRRRDKEIGDFEAEQARLAAETERRRLEDERRAEEARRIDEARRVEEMRKADEARRADEAKRMEEARRAEQRAERARREAERAPDVGGGVSGAPLDIRPPP
jgi:hypothetical protein